MLMMCDNKDNKLLFVIFKENIDKSLKLSI